MKTRHADDRPGSPDGGGHVGCCLSGDSLSGGYRQAQKRLRTEQFFRDKMSYMDAQNLGVASLESYSQALLSLATLKVCTRL